MPLFGAVVGSKIVGCNQNNLSGIENPVIIANSAPSFFTGITSYVDIGDNSIKTLYPAASPITNWSSLGADLGWDMLYIRDRINDAFQAGGQTLAELTPAEQKIMLENFLDEANLTTVFTADQVKEALEKMHVQAIRARKARLRTVDIYIRTSYGEVISNDVIAALKPNSEDLYYVEKGDSGLVEFVQGIGAYAGNGLLNIPSVSGSVKDNAAIQGEILSLLVNGTYTNGSFYVTPLE